MCVVVSVCLLANSIFFARIFHTVLDCGINWRFFAVFVCVFHSLSLYSFEIHHMKLTLHDFGLGFQNWFHWKRNKEKTTYTRTQIDSITFTMSDTVLWTIVTLIRNLPQTKEREKKTTKSHHNKHSPKWFTLKTTFQLIIKIENNFVFQKSHALMFFYLLLSLII